MKEPRTSTFKVGQMVTVQHSNTRYDGRQGPISAVSGGGVYEVDLPERHRQRNGPTGHKQMTTDKAEAKRFKMGCLTALPAKGTQFSLFSHLFNNSQ